MGEIAEMMLDGLMCEQCGEFFDDVLQGGDGPGHPRLCAACLADPANADHWQHELEGRKPKKRRVKNVACPQCGKLFASSYSARQHERDKHGEQT